MRSKMTALMVPEDLRDYEFIKVSKQLHVYIYIYNVTLII